jgi:hypothetical protein
MGFEGTGQAFVRGDPRDTVKSHSSGCGAAKLQQEEVEPPVKLSFFVIGMYSMVDTEGHEKFNHGSRPKATISNDVRSPLMKIWEQTRGNVHLSSRDHLYCTALLLCFSLTGRRP